MLYFSQFLCSHCIEMVLPNDDDDDDDDDYLDVDIDFNDDDDDNVDFFVSSAFICVDVLQFFS